MGITPFTSRERVESHRGRSISRFPVIRTLRLDHLRPSRVTVRRPIPQRSHRMSLRRNHQNGRLRSRRPNHRRNRQNGRLRNRRRHRVRNHRLDPRLQPRYQPICRRTIRRRRPLRRQRRLFRLQNRRRRRPPLRRRPLLSRQWTPRRTLRFQFATPTMR